jgi:Bacterial regulatory proteins, luxR family
VESSGAEGNKPARHQAFRPELPGYGKTSLLANQAIGGQFVVALDTVKKHVSHLLGKLGAANRTEAVARAGELGLIS